MLLILKLVLLTLMLFNETCLMLIFTMAILLHIYEFLTMSTLWFFAPLKIFLDMICLLAYATLRILILIFIWETSRHLFISKIFSTFSLPPNPLFSDRSLNFDWNTFSTVSSSWLLNLCWINYSFGLLT